MMFTLEVGTKVTLTLRVNDAEISSAGIVVSRHLKVGNGIRFVGLADEDNARLRRFLVAL